MSLIEKARAMAVAAGVDPAVVAGEPVEVESWDGDDVVSWGCTYSQAHVAGGSDWFTEHEEVEVATDVFTWEGFPRWSVWVPVS